ncbi:DUF7919 family protein [Streptomyces anulatus]
MTVYRDLSRYEYRENEKEALNVGWLGWRAPIFKRGDVDPLLLNKLKFISLRATAQSRGFHPCPFCFRGKNNIVTLVNSKLVRLGSAQIEVVSNSGVKYISPNLVIHYIEKHSYQPPEIYLDALSESA